MSDLMTRMERMLNPRVVAVVGDKQATNFMWLRNCSTSTGKVYSVQVDPRDIPGIEALGVPNYTSLREIPDEIDYVICAVPRQVAPRVLEDAAAKGVGGVGMFTSGFAETGEELGRELQQRVIDIARAHDMLIIGPNCMGLYAPAAGIRFSADQPAGAGGRVGLISQSGTHGINISLVAAANGIRLSTGVSIGNAVILDVPDYLEYFAQNDRTDVIAMYVEGVRDGRRFNEVFRRVAAQKPVVVWKGGLTAAGARATMSHTASLATPAHIWQALVHQAGAIGVDSLDELIDVVQVLTRAKPFTGNRVALMAMTGGQSVVLTDAFARAGMDIPALAPSSYEQLAGFFNIIGGSYRNPFDMGGTIGGTPEHLDRLFDIIEADPNIDAVAMEFSAMSMARRWTNQPELLDQFLQRVLRHRDRSAKPFVASFHPAHLEAEVAALRAKVQALDIPVLPSFERMARAMAKVGAFYQRRTDA